MQMDGASQALAQRLPTSVPRFSRAKSSQIIPMFPAPPSLLARARGRRPIEAKAQSQQYLVPFGEKAMVDSALQMLDLGTPVRIEHIPPIAFTVTHVRPELDRPLKLPGKNWAKALKNRHPRLDGKESRGT